MVGVKPKFYQPCMYGTGLSTGVAAGGKLEVVG